MKINVLLSISIVVFIILSGCKKKEENTFIPGEQEIQYTGNSSMTIQYYDYDSIFGQEVFIEEKSYSYISKVTIKPPMVASGFTDTNPFSLFIHPVRESGINEEGYLDVLSVLLLLGYSSNLLIQHWNLSFYGDQISGTFAYNEMFNSSDPNIIWAWDEIAGIRQTRPFLIETGATLNGNITEKNISLTITGQTVNTFHKFTWAINATAP